MLGDPYQLEALWKKKKKKNKKLMKDAQKVLATEEERLRKEIRKRNFLTTMKRKDMLKPKQLTLRSRPHTDKWIPVELNEK